MKKETLKSVIQAVILGGPLSVEQLAEVCCCSPSYLYNAARPDADESTDGTGCRFPAKFIIPISRAQKNWAILDYMEHKCGRIAARIPCPADTASDWYKMLAQITVELAHVANELDKALSDNGRVDPHEKPDLIKELTHIQQKAQAMLEAVRRA